MNSFDHLAQALGKTLRNLDQQHISKYLEPFRASLDTDQDRRSRRLTIRRLRFQGEKSGDFSFDDGVNVIRAGNDKGKSSILKLIHFGLTGKNDLKKDVDEWIRIVELEIELDGTAHRLRIEKSKRPRGFLALGKIPESEAEQSTNEPLLEFTNGKDMQRKLESFFNRAFHLRALPGTQKDSRKSSDALLDSVTSYRAYVRGFYINQDRGYVDLVTDGIPYGNLFMKVVGMLLGLQGIDARFAVEARLAHVENELGKEERYSRKIEQDLEVRDLSSLDRDIERIATYVDELKGRRDRLRSGALASDLDRQVEKITDQWLSSTRALHTVEQRISKAEVGISELMNDLGHLENALRSHRTLSSIQPQACPVCDTRIAERTRFPKPDEAECILCHEHLDSDQQTNLEIVELRKQELEQTLARERRRLEAFRGDATALENRSERAHQERNRLMARIRASHKGSAELDREIELEIRYLGRLEAERDSVARVVSEGRGSRLEELMAEKQVISECLRWINEQSSTANGELEREFASQVQELCIRIGFPELEQVRMGPQLKPVIVQNGKTYSFTELSPGEKVRFVLAFYLALAMTAGERRNQRGAHPGLLLIDSPGKEEMVSRDFEAVVSLLRLIEDEHAAKLQVIVASSLPAIGSATADSKQIYIGNDDEPLF